MNQLHGDFIDKKAAFIGEDKAVVFFFCQTFFFEILEKGVRVGGKEGQGESQICSE